MKVIHKHTLLLQQYQYIDSFNGAKFLDIQAQDGIPNMWVEVDDEKLSDRFHLIIVGTGHPVPTGSFYLATYQNVPFVWHFYTSSRRFANGE